MKTKYFSQGKFSLHVNFHVNRFVGTLILLVKNAGGGKGKRAIVLNTFVFVSEKRSMMTFLSM